MIVVENSLDPFKTAYKLRKKLIDTHLILDIVVNRITAFEEASIYSSFQKSIKDNGVLIYVS